VLIKELIKPKWFH